MFKTSFPETVGMARGNKKTRGGQGGATQRTELALALSVSTAQDEERYYFSFNLVEQYKYFHSISFSGDH